MSLSRRFIHSSIAVLAAIDAASELQRRRDRLMTIETLTEMTVDEASSEMVAYDQQLEQLQSRLEVRLLPARVPNT